MGKSILVSQRYGVATGNTEEQEMNDSTTTTITHTLNIFKQYTQPLSHSNDEVQFYCYLLNI